MVEMFFQQRAVDYCDAARFFNISQNHSCVDFLILSLAFLRVKVDLFFGLLLFFFFFLSSQ